MASSIIYVSQYTIGVGIAIFSKQIELDNFVSMGVLFVISVGVLGFCSIIFFNALFHLRNIPQLVKNL